MRRLLLEMIKSESQSKTVPRTNARLLAMLPASGRDKGRLVQALRTLQDAESFESEWAFIQWAKDQGYQPGRPPRDPESLESVLEELTRR